MSTNSGTILNIRDKNLKIIPFLKIIIKAHNLDKRIFKIALILSNHNTNDFLMIIISRFSPSGPAIHINLARYLVFRVVRILSPEFQRPSCSVFQRLYCVFESESHCPLVAEQKRVDILSYV